MRVKKLNVKKSPTSTGDLLATIKYKAKSKQTLATTCAKYQENGVKATMINAVEKTYAKASTTAAPVVTPTFFAIKNKPANINRLSAKDTYPCKKAVPKNKTNGISKSAGKIPKGQ